MVAQGGTGWKILTLSMSKRVENFELSNSNV